MAVIQLNAKFLRLPRSYNWNLRYIVRKSELIASVFIKILVYMTCYTSEARQLTYQHILIAQKQCFLNISFFTFVISYALQCNLDRP